MLGILYQNASIFRLFWPFQTTPVPSCRRQGNFNKLRNIAFFFIYIVILKRKTQRSSLMLKPSPMLPWSPTKINPLPLGLQVDLACFSMTLYTGAGRHSSKIIIDGDPKSARWIFLDIRPFCLDDNSFPMAGGIGEIPSSHLEVHVMICQNKTFNNKCRTSDEINKYFKTISLNLVYANNIFQTNNYTTPTTERVSTN